MVEELVKKAQNGDKKAFENLIRMLEKDLYRIARLRLRDENDICDAVQETILTAYTSITKLKEVEYFKTWLIRILINQCNKVFKERNRGNVISYEDSRESIDLINTTNQDFMLDFEYICSKLNYEDRVIISLYYMERFTDKEIGRILNLNKNSVKTKRTRAKEKIKNFIELGRYNNEKTKSNR